MASLRDKLRAAVPVEKRPGKPPADDCFIKEIRLPLASFDLPLSISGEALAFMQGGEFLDCSREDFLFLDTETTGLSRGAGTVAFLVGIGFFTQESFVVRQYLMRDYDEEEFLLSHLARDMYHARVFCTFNGATFDLPMLEGRYTIKRMREQYFVRPHVDLLPTSRRVWKLRLKRCNLSSLESAVLGLEREDDLPGALVPQRYFDYLKNKEFFLLEDILSHNEQDIISLAHILSRLLTLHAAPTCAQSPEDIFSLGRVYERRGKIEGARMCYRAADKGAVSAMARARMADSFRREGDYAQAAGMYERMIHAHQGGNAPYIALAKIYEHKKRDIARAIEYTQKAIIQSADMPDADMDALHRRYQRLLCKARKERDNGIS